MDLFCGVVNEFFEASRDIQVSQDVILLTWHPASICGELAYVRWLSVTPES